MDGRRGEGSVVESELCAAVSEGARVVACESVSCAAYPAAFRDARDA